MQRRKFLANLAWLTGGAIAQSFIPVQALTRSKKKKVRGRVTGNGQGLPGVVVSDGYSVVTTSKEGKYSFKLHNDATAVFVSTPAGYAFNHEQHIVRYYTLAGKIENEEVNFELTKLDRSDNEHKFIIWADPQVRNAKDVEKMMKHSVPDVQKLVAGLEPGTLIHGITVGDIAWDDLKLFEDYSKAVDLMGIPFFQCLGNHDMDFRKGGDETSDDTFHQVFGPTYYSFNRGQVHYVVMDDVRYLGTERDYDGYILQHQLDWLKKDLATVSKEKLIVLCMHIPLHSGVKNRDELYSILGDRNVHVMTGHTHYHVNNIRGNVYEHNHGTVCGAWWTGPICVDGTPNGYGVYTVKGNEISWYYQSTGKPADHQMAIYLRDKDTAQKEVVVNIWNFDPAWKQEYFVDGVSKGSLQQFEGFDPLAYDMFLGPEKPKARGFAEPHITDHLFSALVPASAKEIRVVATDRFGKTFTSTKTVTEGKV